MPVPRKYHVWEWYDATTQRHYVAFGAVRHSIFPWVRRWNDKCSGRSELDDWLCQWPYSPPPSGTLPSEPLHKAEAAQFAWDRLQQLRLLGAKVMSARPRGTWSGGGSGKTVISPDGKKYASVREAARAEGVNPCTITRRCAAANGWRYEETSAS